jgi:hypothetical protein
MEMVGSSTTTHRSVKFFERWLLKVYSNEQTNLMIVITRSSNLESFIRTKYVVSFQVVTN